MSEPTPSGLQQGPDETGAATPPPPYGGPSSGQAPHGSSAGGSVPPYGGQGSGGYGQEPSSDPYAKHPAPGYGAEPSDGEQYRGEQPPGQPYASGQPYPGGQQYPAGQQYPGAQPYPGGQQYPGAQPYPYPAQPYPGQGYGYAPAGPKTNTLAVVSLVTSLLGLLFILPVVGSLAAVITGHMARKQIRERGEEGSGMATAGLVMGYIGLVVAVIAVVAIIAVVVGTASTVPDYSY